MLPFSRLAVWCCLLVLLAGCSSAAPYAQHASGPAQPAISPQQHVPADRYLALINASADLGSIHGSQPVTALLSLADPGQHMLSVRLAAMEDPHSPLFGQTLSVAQLDRLAGPNVPAVQRARYLLAAHGITTSWNPGDSWMVMTGPAWRVQRLFHVRIHRYRAQSGRVFYADPAPGRIPATLRGVVTGLSHITDYDQRVPFARAAATDSYGPGQLVSAYNLTPLRGAGLTGAGITVAFIETDGFKQKDFDAFTHHFGLPAMRPTIKYGKALSGVEGETEMDLEVVHEIAPGAKLTVYNCPGQCDDNQMLKTEDAAIRNTGRGVISISLGGCEPDEGRITANAEASTFSRADALGESVFVASGDSGAYTCLTRDWGAPPAPKYVGASIPAVMPGVTAVGGTHLLFTGGGTWKSEQVWEEPPQTTGSGGGVSTYFGRPSWQNVRGASPSRRSVPDVAAVADPNTSPAVEIDGQLTPGGGTSEAAPIWAGMTALIDQYLLKKRERTPGFMNPALYSFAAHAPYPPYHDITVGSNLVNPAGPGYDLATGLGSPNGWNLARDLAAYVKGRK